MSDIEIDLTINETQPIELEFQSSGPTFEMEFAEQTIISQGAYITKTASTAIGGNRIVCADVNDKLIYADKDTAAHLYKIIGITTGAIEENASGTVQISGEMIETSWNWTPGQFIYLGNNGLLTQTPPTTGFLLVVAFAITATKIMIEKQLPIQL